MIEIAIRRDWGSEKDFYGPKNKFRMERIFKLLRKFLPEGRVLDAGSGAGMFSKILSESGYEVVAVDVSPNCVYSTRELATKISRVERYGLAELPYVEEFDAIICGDVIEHVERDELALERFKTALRPGGIAIISTAYNPNMWSREDSWSGHYRRYTSEEFFKKVMATGLSIEEIYYYGPITKLYFFTIYQNFLKNEISSNKTVKSSILITLGKYLFYLLFHLDILFHRIPNGIYFIAVIRKKGEVV